MPSRHCGNLHQLIIVLVTSLRTHIFDDMTMVTDEKEGAAVGQVELHANQACAEVFEG